MQGAGAWPAGQGLPSKVKAREVVPTRPAEMVTTTDWSAGVPVPVCMHSTPVAEAHAAVAQPLSATCVVVVRSLVWKLSPATVMLSDWEYGRLASVVALTTGAAPRARGSATVWAREANAKKRDRRR